ncbi:MAG: hypothetical protein QOG92_264, partial [Verrucomicrobiota bacterium]|nr:hypothetical protein [Verrucomicrobiota bacterium]
MPGPNRGIAEVVDRALVGDIRLLGICAPKPKGQESIARGSPGV